MLLHGMHTTNHPSKVKIFLIFQKCLKLVALVYVSRGENVYQYQLVSRLLRNGPKLGKMGQDDI